MYDFSLAGTSATSMTSHNHSPQEAPSANEFKTYAVGMFSSLLRTAGWVIQGADNRTSFQEHLLSLHTAWGDLWGSVTIPVNDRTYKVSFTPLEGGIILKDHMASIHGGLNSESKDTTTVIGTISLGISIESTKMDVQSEDASSIPHREATILQNALKAQVVSVADLEQALTGEMFLNNPTASSSTTAILPTPIDYFFIRSGSITGETTPTPRDKIKEELENTKRELERSQKEVHAYRKELEQKTLDDGKQIAQIQSDNVRLEDRLLNSQHELANVQRKLDDAKALADTNARELQGAQVSFTKADSLAISDLSTRVTQLNEEIFQTAASLVKVVCRKQWNLPKEETMRCAEDASRIIGPHLVLITLEHAKNPNAPIHPFLVQVVLQVFLNTFCFEKIAMWALSEPVHGVYLRSLYQAIREKGETITTCSVQITE